MTTLAPVIPLHPEPRPRHRKTGAELRVILDREAALWGLPSLDEARQAAHLQELAQPWT